jgi:pimeloyl-ACP methyl ester carboxylesterase
MPYANNNGVRIYYEVEGQGPPLVLVHGFSGSGESWRERGYTELLANDYRLILVDVRGHGLSDKPRDRDAYAYPALISDLVAVLDDLHIERAIYLGYSMGGRIGFRIPAFTPRRFRALILGGAAYPTTANEDSHDDFLAFLQDSLEAGIEKFPESPMDLHVVNLERRSGQRLPRERRASILRNDAWALLAAIRGFREAASPGFKTYLANFRAPCLLFAGEADPRLGALRKCAKHIRSATLFFLPGLDHSGAFDRSDLVVPHIKEFLAGVSKK